MKGVYPGSFDPFTLGHKDIAERALKLCSTLYIAVSDNINKSHLFTKQERVEMIKEVFKHEKNVTVESFNGLLVDYMVEKQAAYIIRGLRAVSDFEYEFQIAYANRSINHNVETIFMVPDSRYLFLSSTIVKDIARNKGSVANLVSENINKKILEKYK